MSTHFIYDERLGIRLPHLEKEWDMYTKEEQAEILLEWETIRGKIPDRIIELEQQINEKQRQLGEENDFALSCMLNSEIASLASMINDLWIWYRMNQTVTNPYINKKGAHTDTFFTLNSPISSHHGRS
ncbi:hypothetical protein [Anoxybacillus flavithermus]|uniref:hypothetical protein n=1 Tax=Anoxybacillus flavithermus TaxID=33934 RepID=UPI001F505539|nr:hypothetical protein [Anoxybacillus flavithermus]